MGPRLGLGVRRPPDRLMVPRYYRAPDRARELVDDELGAYVRCRPAGRPWAVAQAKVRPRDELRAEGPETRDEIHDLVACDTTVAPWIPAIRSRARPGAVRRPGVRRGGDASCLVDSSLDFYLTASRFTEEFEAGVADYLGSPTPSS